MSVEWIDHYEILAEIGHGGMATVYHARDPEGKEAAVKVLRREYLTDLGFRARFEREVQTIAGLEHPATVPLLDFGQHEEQLYLVMPFMPGGSLALRLHQGALSPQAAGTILNRIAAALDSAHARGVVHRDLKPSNILLDADDQAYLSDFGIALLTSAEGVDRAIVGGTPAYMSPEQGRPEAEVDGRSDIYSLGVTLFQMLTGYLPFSGDTPLAILTQHILQPPPTLQSLNPDLPAALGPVIDRALAKEPADRFPTAGELSAAYQQALDSPVVINEAMDDSPEDTDPLLVEEAVAESQPAANWTPDGTIQPGRSLQARALLQVDDVRHWLAHHFVVAMALASILGMLCAVSAVMAIRGSAVLQAWSDRDNSVPISRATPTDAIFLPLVAVDDIVEAAATAPTLATSESPVELPPGGTSAPNLLLTYNKERMTAINISTRNLSLRGLTFRRQAVEGSIAAAFAADEWLRVARRDVAALQPGDCLQFLRLDIPSPRPQEPPACMKIKGWLATRREERLFFLPAAGAGAFEVYKGEQLIDRCPIDAGECWLYIPQS